MLKEALYAQGAVYAAMSGSGSAVYGIMPKGQKAVIESAVNVETMYIE
jgi:4-diphosphocytidyl-2C-methyl-D-erythritol kinase